MEWQIGISLSAGEESFWLTSYRGTLAAKLKTKFGSDIFCLYAKPTLSGKQCEVRSDLTFGRHKSSYAIHVAKNKDEFRPTNYYANLRAQRKHSVPSVPLHHTSLALVHYRSLVRVHYKYFVLVHYKYFVLVHYKYFIIVHYKYFVLVHYRYLVIFGESFYAFL